MATIDLDADEWLELNDVFEHDEMAWRITRLEANTGPVEELEAANLVRAVAPSRHASRQNHKDTRRISTPDVLIVEEGTTFKKQEQSLTLASKHGVFEQYILEKAVHCVGQLMHPKLNECICMNHHDQNDSNRRPKRTTSGMERRPSWFQSKSNPAERAN